LNFWAIKYRMTAANNASRLRLITVIMIV